MLARRIDLKMSYDDVDISEDISRYVESIQYADNASGQSDDFQIQMEDRAGHWKEEWFPAKGARLKVDLVAKNWKKDGDELKFPCGAFEIDEIELSGKPTKIKIKALSVFVAGSLREKRTKGWESITIETIAKEISQRHKLGLFYDAAYNPAIERKDQNEESDLSFLQQICRDAGLCLKITDGKIVIFDEAQYEAKEAVMTITEKDMYSYAFTSKITEIYRACEVAYQDEKKGQKISHTFVAPDVSETEKTLKINQKVASEAEAQRLAKKKLREKNRSQTEAKITVKWNPNLAAANVVAFRGFGKFDGNYFIDKVAHNIKTGGGSTMALELHRRLEGY